MAFWATQGFGANIWLTRLRYVFLEEPTLPKFESSSQKNQSNYWPNMSENQTEKVFRFQKFEFQTFSVIIIVPIGIFQKIIIFSKFSKVKLL